jgi:hypothetical protein
MKRIRSGLALLKNDIYELRWAALGLTVYYIVVHIAFGQFCLMKIFLHIPCPGCGMTRAFFLALTGHIKAAWRLQPLIFGWILWAVWFGAERYLGQKRSVLLRVYLVCLLLLTLALYGYRMLYGFPTGI